MKVPLLSETEIASIRWNADALIPAIVQDVETKQVLMLAYMNETSLKETLQCQEAVFWSRSRRELWYKGATSGHTQRVHEIRLDCDQDALLLSVEANGPACHTGKTSCFDSSDDRMA